MMNIRSDKEFVRANLFPVVFTVWCVTDILQSTSIISETLNWGITAINDIIFVLLMLHIIFCQVYSARELAVIGGISVTIILSTFFSSLFHLLSLWMFIVAVKRTDFEIIIKRTYKVLLCMIPVIVLCGNLGVLNDVVICRGSTVRHSLGFIHPNDLGKRIFQLVILHFFVHRNRLRIWDYLFLLAAVLFVYMVPNSQTACVCMLVLFAGVMLWPLVKWCGDKFVGIYHRSLTAMALLFNILSVVCSLSITGNSSFRWLDTFLSKRFSMCHSAFKTYGINLLGTPIFINNVYAVGRVKEQFYLDNGYMSLLLRFGILAYALFSCVYIAKMIQSRQRHQDMLLLCLFCYALYGVMETGVYRLSENIFLLSLASLLYSKGAAECSHTESDDSPTERSFGGKGQYF